MKKINRDWVKIFLIYNVVNIAIILIFYKLVPIILGYPPDSLNNDFQRDVNGGITYNLQYIVIVFLGTIIENFYLYIKLRKIHKLQKEVNGLKLQDSCGLYQKLVKKMINLPYAIYAFQVVIPPALITIMFLLLNDDLTIVLKAGLLFFTMFTLMSNISYVFVKGVFKSILININLEILKLNDSSFDLIKLSRKRGIKFNILMFTIPVFIVSTIFVGLLSYSSFTRENGNLAFEAYDEKIKVAFNSNEYIQDASFEKLSSLLSTIKYISPEDVYFIVSPSGEIVTSDNSKLSDFFVKYMQKKSDEQGGKVYEFYGVDIMGIVQKIQSNNGEWIIGIKYEMLSYLIAYFFGVLAILLIMIILLVYYFSKSITDDINIVSKRLYNITKQKNIDFNDRLPITSNDEIGDLTRAFNKVQDLTKQNIEKIKDSQQVIMEKDRLASLGQLIGGIAHNLKTPIMSIAGASEGLKDLVKEYDSSIEDAEVTPSDHHEIAGEMDEWIEKIKTHTSYMSDVITAVKGQAVALSAQEIYPFTMDELVKRVDILMKHELKNALINMNIKVDVPRELEIKGNINSLIQVINNMISNSIQAYNGKTNENIDFNIGREGNRLVISIRDYGSGIPKKIQDKLLKEMVTTKGKNGTGLGLFMSYSNIKAHFSGDLRFESEEGVGTTFYIYIPIE